MNKIFTILIVLFALISCKSTDDEFLPSANMMIPKAPSNLSGLISTNQVSLSWVDNSTDEKGFNIERRNMVNGVGFEVVGKVNANENRFIDSNLDSSITYQYRVNAFNDYGASAEYSNIFNLISPIKKETFGSQVWWINSLDVVTYSDGTPIPQVEDPIQWANLTTGAWCYYNNDSTNNKINGKLYNWYAVAGIFDEASKTDLSKRKKLTPVGTVATNDEWLELKLSLSFSGQDFKFLNGGYRNIDGTFEKIGTRGYYWTSSQNGSDAAWSRTNNLNGDLVYKKMGLSVRVLEQKNTSKNDFGLPEWTKIPDDKFEKSLISQGIDDLYDGKVLTSKVSSLKIFRMEHTRVKDITGIESFVSLEFLSLWDNDFTTINVRSLKKLKILGLSECPIDTIDLSQNKELVEIDFQHASDRASEPTYPYGKTLGFTKLDLSKNTKMQRIYLWTNRIKELDVSMLPNLTDLWIGGSAGDGLKSGNPIKSLDLSKNPNLNVIVAGGCDLQFLNIKGTANNGVPRTCTTNNNPNLFEIKVTSVAAINAYRNTMINGNPISAVWYAKDDHTKYVE